MNNSQLLLSNNNIIRSRRRCQHCRHVDPEPLFKTNQELELFFRGCELYVRKIYNFLLFLHTRHREAFPKQETIARFAGVSRKTVSEVLLKLEELNLITSCYRHMSSCIYKLPRMFNDLRIRDRFKYLFNSLSLLPLQWLMMVPIAVHEPISRPQFPGLFPGRVTQYNSNIYLPTIISMDVQRQLLIEREKTGQSSPSRTYRTQEREPLTKELKIRPIVLGIKTLKLTQAGMCRLSAFPDEALLYAEKNMGYTTKIRMPFEYFCKLCVAYCKDNRLWIDYEYVNKLLSSMGLNTDSPVLVERNDSLSTKHEAKPVHRPHGFGKCADSSCKSLVCYDEQHPPRNHEWARQEREKLLLRRNDISKLFGEQLANKLLGFSSSGSTLVLDDNKLMDEPNPFKDL